MSTTEKVLYQYLIHLGDNALIIGHRLSEWCGHGPALEQDIAMTNLALDFIGQARNYFQYAAKIEGLGKSEDEIAYFRDSSQYRNLLLLEQINQDFAKTLARQFFYDSFHEIYLRELCLSNDIQMSAMAEKHIKEVKYHVKWSGDWILRMGDGTQESHERIQNALNLMWRYTDEMFQSNPDEKQLASLGIIPDVSTLKAEWLENISKQLAEATLQVPGSVGMQYGGKQGKHSEHLGFILAEMQYLQRAYPGNNW